MDIREAMLQRHSVRAYDDQPITGEDLDKLEALISACNAESGLHIQLVTDEPQAFQSRLARYGHFSGVRNYIVMVGRRQMKDLDEVCGYFGEKIVLEAQQMGLRTCWVGATYKKIPEAFEVNDDEKLVIVIAIGYGLDDGTERKRGFTDLVQKRSQSRHAGPDSHESAEIPSHPRVGQSFCQGGPRSLCQGRPRNRQISLRKGLRQGP